MLVFCCGVHTYRYQPERRKIQWWNDNNSDNNSTGYKLLRNKNNKNKQTWNLSSFYSIWNHTEYLFICDSVDRIYAEPHGVDRTVLQYLCLFLLIFFSANFSRCSFSSAIAVVVIGTYAFHKIDSVQCCPKKNFNTAVGYEMIQTNAATHIDFMLSAGDVYESIMLPES